MKKILFTLVSIGLIGTTQAQDAADKTFQAGLVFGAGLNFQKMGTKLVNSAGAGNDLTIGGNMNFMFSETIGLTTGVEFDFNTTKYKPGSSDLYYLYNDNSIASISIDEKENQYINGFVNTTDKQIFQIVERRQKATYLTIPTMLLFRTNFIGYMRYFGKFGLRSSFLLTQKINDTGYNLDQSYTNTAANDLGPVDNENMKAKSEMFFFKSAAGIAGGAEWNFVGSTCLVAEIGYYYGFTPLYYNRKNAYLYTAAVSNGEAVDRTFSNKATQSQVQLKISILF